MFWPEEKNVGSGMTAFERANSMEMIQAKLRVLAPTTDAQRASAAAPARRRAEPSRAESEAIGGNVTTVTDPLGLRVRPANDSDREAVLELATVMAVSFTVERGPFLRSFAAVLDAPSAHLLVIDSGSTVGGYLLGFEHPAFFANGFASVEKTRNLSGQLYAVHEHNAILNWL